MVFRLNIRTDNAAFEDDPSPELARLLRECADRVESGNGGHGYDMFQTIFDVNGNDVGRFALKPDDYR